MTGICVEARSRGGKKPWQFFLLWKDRSSVISTVQPLTVWKNAPGKSCLLCSSIFLFPKGKQWRRTRGENHNISNFRPLERFMHLRPTLMLSPWSQMGWSGNISHKNVLLLLKLLHLTNTPFLFETRKVNQLVWLAIYDGYHNLKITPYLSNIHSHLSGGVDSVQTAT